MKSGQQTFVVVTPQEAKQTPYPYLYVEDDGSVRELRPDEKSYLETPFLPMDGARPAIKESFSSKNGWGSQRGFCHRDKIPDNIDILDNGAEFSPGETAGNEPDHQPPEE